MDDDDAIDEVEVAMDDVDDATAKKKSQRTRRYTVNEDRCLCEAWMIAISQDPIWGTEQKVGAYWRKVTKYFHERGKFHLPNL
jgi:hypothetical protein